MRRVLCLNATPPLAVVSLIAMTLFSCSEPKEKASPQHSQSLYETPASTHYASGRSAFSDSLYRVVARRPETIQSLIGNGTLDIQSPEINQRLSCRIIAERGNAIQLTATVFFGFTAFDMMLRPDSLFISIPFQSAYYIGGNEADALNRISGITADFNAMISLLTGVPPLELPLDSAKEILNGDGRIIYRFYSEQQGHSTLTDEIALDSLQGVLLYVIRHDGSRQSVIRCREYEVIDTGDDTVLLPRDITLALSDTDTLGVRSERIMRFRYQRRQINPKAINFTFKEPKSARRINLNSLSTPPKTLSPDDNVEQKVNE